MAGETFTPTYLLTNIGRVQYGSWIIPSTYLLTNIGRVWTEFTMNDVEHCLMWTLWNYIIVNPEWHGMDVKWFDWNLNKTVQRMKLCSVINLLAWNPNRELPFNPVTVYMVEINERPRKMRGYDHGTGVPWFRHY